MSVELFVAFDKLYGRVSVVPFSGEYGHNANSICTVSRVPVMFLRELG